MIFHMYNTKTYTKECGYFLAYLSIQALLTFNDDKNMTSQNFNNSFSDENHIFFVKKTSVANVNVAAIFTQHFILNFTICHLVTIILD